MKARGKRVAKRSASPLVSQNQLKVALKVRNTIARYSALSELNGHSLFYPGATRLAALSACPWLFIFRAVGVALAPGFYIPRRRLCACPWLFIFRAVGAALAPGFYIPRRRRCACPWL